MGESTNPQRPMTEAEIGQALGARPRRVIEGRKFTQLEGHRRTEDRVLELPPGQHRSELIGLLCRQHTEIMDAFVEETA